MSSSMKLGELIVYTTGKLAWTYPKNCGHAFSSSADLCLSARESEVMSEHILPNCCKECFLHINHWSYTFKNGGYHAKHKYPKASPRYHHHLYPIVYSGRLWDYCRYLFLFRQHYQKSHRWAVSGMNSSGHRHSPIHSGLGTVDAQAMGILGHLDPRDCQYRASLSWLRANPFNTGYYKRRHCFHYRCDLPAGRWQCS